MNQLLILLPVLSFCLVWNATIEEKLEQARLEYGLELERQRTILLDTLQKKEDAARRGGKVQLVEQIKKDREAFEKDDVLPSSVSLETYKRGVKLAKTKLKTALESAVREYLQAKNDAAAKELNIELEELQRATAPPPKEKNASATPIVVAEWVHRPTGPGKGPSEIKLYSNGLINNPNGRDTWTLQGRRLTLRWQNPNAPGGAWVDICQLSQDGLSFKGKNQQGADIFGKRILPQPKKAEGTK